MNARLLTALLILVAVPTIALAAAQDAPEPNVDPGIDAPDPDPDVAFDEVFVPIERNTCPLEDGLEPDQLQGTTGWLTRTHPGATDGCVALWGQGDPFNPTYERGSKAALEAPEMPTRHLAASGAPTQTVNTATSTLIESGVDPRIVAPVIAGIADGCATIELTGGEGSQFRFVRDVAMDMCREVLTSPTVLLDVPEAPLGLGGLFLELDHAYAFSDPDENRFAPDGAWVEIRAEDDAFKRLNPVGLFSPADEGIGMLCAASAPMMMGLDATTRTESPFLPAFFPIRDLLQTLEAETIGDEMPEAFADAIGSPSNAALSVLPTSEREWNEDCAGLIASTHGEQIQPVDETLAGERVAPSAPPEEANRFSPYPGTVRGEGPGFVGSTEDATGQLQFITHWFDLSPYAGETVEIRLIATSGAGLGTQQGGWLVDNMNLRYTGPPDDLSVRIETPQEDDVLPASISEITPGGMVPVEAIVENLGRTTSQEAIVELSMGSQSTNVTVPSLDPLESHRVTAMLPAPNAPTADVTATLAQHIGVEGEEANAPYADSYPPNDEDTLTVSFDTVEDILITIDETNLEDGEANVTLTVENRGNFPETVPLEATIAPVDLVTRTSRALDAQPLGPIDSVIVPHSEDENTFGVADPTRTLTTTIPLPHEGVWEITIESPEHEGTETSAMVAFGEATPTALQEPFSRVSVGPTDEISRAAFELLEQARGEDDEPVAFTEDIRHAIAGPETRFVPYGDFAIATSGQELPDEWAAVRSPPEENVYVGPDREESDEDDPCGVEATFGDLPGVGSLPQDVANVPRTFVSSLMCGVSDAANPWVVDGAQVKTTEETRVPASLQMWNVREHHVSIYGVGTDEDNTQGIRALDAVTIQEDDERVYLEFDHAANVNWHNDRGAKAQLVVVPGGQLDLVEEMREMENQTRELTQDLPPEGQALVNTVLMDLFFETVIQTADTLPANRLPHDICRDLPLTETLPGPVESTLLTFCGDTQVFDGAEQALSETGLEVDFTDHIESTIIHRSSEADQADGLVKTWETPVGWENERIDITRIVEETTSDAAADEGFYVMFDLVTTSDLDTFLASARADVPGEGDQAGYSTEMHPDEDDWEEAPPMFARTGWETGETPVWTVSAPVLDRVSEEDILQERVCFGADPSAFAAEDENPDVCSRPLSPPDTRERTLTPSDTRGWETFPEEASVETAWSYEQRGGDPSSQAPGAFVWEGDAGAVINTVDGPRTVIDQPDPDTYGVLRSPVVTLSGYEMPVVEMNVQWGMAEAGSPDATDAFPEGMPLTERCEEQSDASEATVWTRVGWNVRATPVLENGELGETRTVQPLSGYDSCSDEGDVPVLFDGRAIHRAPHAYQLGAGPATSALVGDVNEDHPFPGSGVQRLCTVESPHQEAIDPMRFCRPAELAFGHEEPVFALPMSGWNDIAFDLSPFQGEDVIIEVHAFGVNADEGDTPRGELRVDAFEVAEGQPPFDVRAMHEDRPTIAPDTQERFEVIVENRGSDTVEEIDIRRVVIGPDGCQPEEVPPVVTSWLLVDPDTGQPGLTPGQETLIRNPQLGWDVPDDTLEVYERLITVDTGTLSLSQAPKIDAGVNDEGTITAFVQDPDDCADDVTVDTSILRGTADVDTDGNQVTVRNDDGDDSVLRSPVKIEATDRHGVEALPAYVLALPHTDRLEADFTFTPEEPETGQPVTFDASPTEEGPAPIETYHWDFDDGETETGEEVNHAFTREGVYDVTLTVTDEDEWESSITKRVIVTDPSCPPEDEDPTCPVIEDVIEALQGDTTPETPDDDLDGDALVEARVLQSAQDATGQGSAVNIHVEPPSDGLFTQLLIPCEGGEHCANNLIELAHVQDVTVRDLPPGHYVGFVMFGQGVTFEPVEFTIEEEPQPGADARPGDNTLTLRSEIQENPSMSVSSIDVPKLVPKGDDIAFPVEIENTGNVDLDDVTVDITLEPLGLTLEADRIPRLSIGETRTTTATVDLENPGPLTVHVETTANADDTAVTASSGVGVIVVDRIELEPEPGNHEHWTVTEDGVRFGDGLRIPANANSILPLAGLMDTASSPFSLLEVNVSGELERAYDGVSIEWRPADADIDARGHLVDEDEIPHQAYRLPGQTLEGILGPNADATLTDRADVECDPIIDTSDIRDLAIPIHELANPETYACHDLPLGGHLTSSHAGGTPGEITPAITGQPTMGLDDRDAQRIQAAATDLPGAQLRPVDMITPDDWVHFGGFTLETDRDRLDSGSAFWFPTATLTDVGGERFEHQLRVPLTLGEWCGSLQDVVRNDERLQVFTDERRLFSDAWEVHIRLDPGALNHPFMTAPTLTGERLSSFEDPTTTGWTSAEYDIPHGALSGLFTRDIIPVADGLGIDSCQDLDDAEDEELLSNAEIVLELSTDIGPDPEALEVGWFVGTIKVPALDLEIGADTSNHKPEACLKAASWGGWTGWQQVEDREVVLGCTTITTAGEPRLGSLDAEDSDHIDDLSGEQTVASVDVSSSDVPLAHHGGTVNELAALLDERPMDIDDRQDEDDEDYDVLTTHPSGYDHDGDDVFRYVDAVALVDLRSGQEGQITFDIDNLEEGGSIVAQIVAASLPPEETASEAAPSRVEWTPLEPCDPDDPTTCPAATPEILDTCGEPNTVSAYPDGPLGATSGSIIGPIQGPHTTLEEYGQDEALCANVAPVGGEIAFIGLRLWMPNGNEQLDIQGATVTMDVPEPQQLAPQLRALSDDTVQEGTLTVHDVAILSMPPAFTHDHSVTFNDPATWTLEDGTKINVLEANSTPSFTVEIQQPSLEASWEIEKANITVRAEVEGQDDKSVTEYELDIEGESGEGPATIHVPWEDIRETIDWFEDTPVLPANVTSISLEINTKADTLVDTFPDCPRDLDDLARSQQPQCRLLSDIVQDPSPLKTDIETETNLTQNQGIRSISITPDRAPAETERTATLDLVNPSSLPVRLTGDIALTTPGGEAFLEIPLEDHLLDPWEALTVTTTLPPLTEGSAPFPLDEPQRVIVEATVGESTVRDDYRTTVEHENTLIEPFFFNEDHPRVEQTSDAAKPSLLGQTSDGVGWSIEAAGGDQPGVIPLATNTLTRSSLETLLEEDEDPLLVFQHQRLLRGFADEGGAVSYMGASLCPGTSEVEPSEAAACVHLHEAWAPEGTTTLTPRWQSMPGSEEQFDRCTEEDHEDPHPNMAAYGITSPRPNVLDGSTGVVNADDLDSWETAAFTIPQKAIENVPEFFQDGEQVMHLRIWLGQCDIDRQESQIIIDDVALASARPILDIGADEVPIWPGSEKQYRFTLENPGSASETLHLAPASSVPDDWHITIMVEEETVTDTRTGTVEPVTLEQGETLHGIVRAQAPADARSPVTLPITAYATSAPGLMSSGAIHNAATGHETPDDPGRLVLDPERVDLPDLIVNEDAITVEDAEIARETRIQIQIENQGFAPAEEVPIAAAVRGPSGFQQLSTPAGDDLATVTIQPGDTSTLTYTWRPLEPGEHTVRIVADPDPHDIEILLDDDIHRFLGIVQERQECEPGLACPNVVDHAFTVMPLQRPDLRLTVHGVPDRISIGDEAQLEVLIENLGGKAATDTTLRLSENGLLPIFDTMTIDVPRIEPGETVRMTADWAPVSPGEGLVLASISAPDMFTGPRPDGSSAAQDSEAAIGVTIDRAEVSLSLEETLRTVPGTASAVMATLTNDGTAPVHIMPETQRQDGIFLAPALNQTLLVPPGEEATFPLLGFAEIGTSPTSLELPLPVSQGSPTAIVHVDGQPDARITMEDAALEPGESSVDARITNIGNVPLDGDLLLRGDGIQGIQPIDIAPGETANVTVPLTVDPDVSPGANLVAAHVTTSDDERVTQTARMTVDAAPAVSFTLRSDEAPLTGSAHGELIVRNVGNEFLEGRAVLEPPVALTGSALLELEPGESTVLPVTWLAGTNRTGEATVYTVDGDVVGTTTLAPEEVGPQVRLSSVETRPNVNLAEGDEVQVTGTLENVGEATLENHTLGLTVDGQLYQTFETPTVEPGEVTVVSVPIELPKSGEITLGLVDLAAFQRGDPAGAAVTIEASASPLGLGAMLDRVNLPWLSTMAPDGALGEVRLG